jgi:predicted nucleotidyltransferase
MIIDRLQKEGLIAPPKWLPANTHFLVQMGSEAYAASSNDSDIDVYGFCIPPKDDVFPHLAGTVLGFGPPPERFNVWTEHHIKWNAKEYDFSVYSIVSFFHLLMANNPNMIDALFVPRRCVLHSTAISERVRDQRRLFLHKGSFHKFRGYAYSQLAKIRTKEPGKNSKRAASVAEFGYDVKFAYHVVRLALEAEQILTTQDLDLECNGALLRDIRAGGWSLARLEGWFEDKERALESMAAESKLPAEPDIEAIRELLLTCLEMHYGSLKDAVVRDTSALRLLTEMQDLLNRHKA